MRPLYAARLTLLVTPTFEPIVDSNLHSRLRTGIFNPPVKLTATLPKVKLGNNNELLGKHQVIILILTRNTACILEENFRDQF